MGWWVVRFPLDSILLPAVTLVSSNGPPRTATNRKNLAPISPGSRYFRGPVSLAHLVPKPSSFLYSHTVTWPFASMHYSVILGRFFFCSAVARSRGQCFITGRPHTSRSGELLYENISPLALLLGIHGTTLSRFRQAPFQSNGNHS